MALPADLRRRRVIDQGSHLIDLCWFSEPYGRLRSGSALFWNIPADDNCFLALRTASGGIAWLHASWTEWKNTFSFEISGRDGKLAIEGLGGSYGVERLTHYRMLPEMGPPETSAWEYPQPDRSWELEFADLVAAIRDGCRPCGDIADAVANLAIVGEVYRRYRS